ncbi:MAG: hypothetical protein EBT15_11555 [Betaproteobacteria bacterium]|nr:hypothetical protein [Betaproteobacteria bacterium]
MQAAAEYQREVTYVAVKTGHREWFWRAYNENGREVAQGHATSRSRAMEKARVAVINKTGMIRIND